MNLGDAESEELECVPPLHTRLRGGEVLVGSWMQFGSPAVMEYLSTMGFDWLTVDLEHTDITIERFAELMRGAGGRIPVFARVKENAPLDIRQVLDVGAVGVIVPLIRTAGDARAAVAAAKYPPLGDRGYAHCRANDYGRAFESYAATANETTIVLVMVETRDAVENIDQILEVQGLDGVVIGPYDLSGSYGTPGQTDTAQMRDALSRVGEACLRHGKTAGVHVVVPTADSLERAVRQGFRFIAAGMDTVFLEHGGKTCLELVTSVTGEVTDSPWIPARTNGR